MSKKKKVTAPLSYDPGKGRPKEYLAYLNWQEMQALRRLNGNNMERGPMGLPSFPPDWKGSANSTGNWSGSGGSVSPGGREGGGSDSGSRGSPSSSAPNAAAANAAAKQTASDSTARQAAETKNATAAASNSALSQDAKKGGIASINVGPMQTPVRIGSGAISQAAASAAPTMPGGGGMGQYNARRGSSTIAVGPKSGVDAFNNIATGSLYGTPPGAARAYDALESDLSRRALTRAMTQETLAPSIAQNAPEGVFGPRISGGIPSYLSTTSMPGMITTGMPSNYSGIVRDRNTTVAYKTPESIVGTPENVTNVFKTPPPAASISEMTDYVETPFETEVPYTPYRPTFAAGTYTTPYNLDSPISATEQAAIDRQYQYMGMAAPGYDVPNNYNTDQATLDRLAGVYEGAGIGAAQQIVDVEESYRNQPGEGVAASVIPSKFNYPVKPDGTPYTAEDLQNLPPSVLSDYMDKVRFARMTDTPYPMTPAQKEKAFVAKGLGRVISANPLTRAFVAGTNLIGKGIRALPGEMGDEFGGGLADAGEALRDPGAAVEAYETANPLRRAQMEVLAGEPNYIPGSRPSYSGTSYAGRIPTQEPGGKGNDFGPSSSSSYPSYSGGDYSAASAAEEGRPSQYYLWDLGVGVPSPGDPEYNDYQEYLKDRGKTA